MSRATSYPASITGHAVVRLKDGNSYVGWGSYDGRAITLDGSLRVIVNGVVEYRAAKRWTWPLQLVHHVVWDDDACQAASG